MLRNAIFVIIRSLKFLRINFWSRNYFSLSLSPLFISLILMQLGVNTKLKVFVYQSILSDKIEQQQECEVQGKVGEERKEERSYVVHAEWSFITRPQTPFKAIWIIAC